MSLRALLCGCGFLFVFAVTTPAAADPITVTFWAFPDPTDPILTANVKSTGSFSFDRSLIPIGGGILDDREAGLPITDFDFTWGPVHWTMANAGVSLLMFNPAGELTAFAFGGRVTGLLGVSRFTDDIFGLEASQVPHSTDILSYTFTAAPEKFFLTDLYSSINPTPEPSSIVLALTGAAFLGRRLRRRRAVPIPDGSIPLRRPGQESQTIAPEMT